jgi:hypothetical protein
VREKVGGETFIQFDEIDDEDHQLKINNSTE